MHTVGNTKSVLTSQDKHFVSLEKHV
jgi:hypothetical protein